MKKIIIVLIILISLFLIYNFFNKESINYVAIGDTLNRGINSYNTFGYGYNDYLKNYLVNNNLLNNFNDKFYNTSISNLTRDILNNQTIICNNKEINIKKTLRESDVLVIGIGMDELAYFFNNDYLNINDNFNNFIDNLQEFIKVVREYAKNKIIFLGYYNPLNNYYSEIDQLFYKLDSEIDSILTKYQVTYIPLYEKIKNSHYKENNNYHLNTNGYLMIAKEIIKYVESR